MVIVKLQIHPRVGGGGGGSWPIPREVGMAGAGFHPQQQAALPRHDGKISGMLGPPASGPGAQATGGEGPPSSPPPGKAPGESIWRCLLGKLPGCLPPGVFPSPI